MVEKNTMFFDPNIATVKINQPFYPSDYSSSWDGSKSFSINESLSNDQQIRFKWSGITITGARQGYSVPSSNYNGTVGDFSV